MEYLKIVLRLIHILSGVFWVGGAVFLNFFIGPTVKATGEAGQKFMTHLVTRAKISMRITISAILTVLAGGWLYWIDAGGSISGWAGTVTGWGFGIGGIFGIIGLVFGIMVGMNIQALVTMGGQIQGKPTPEQMNRVQTIQKRLEIVGTIGSVVLILALACMTTARYW